MLLQLENTPIMQIHEGDSNFHFWEELFASKKMLQLLYSTFNFLGMKKKLHLCCESLCSLLHWDLALYYRFKFLDFFLIQFPELHGESKTKTRWKNIMFHGAAEVHWITWEILVRTSRWQQLNGLPQIYWCGNKLMIKLVRQSLMKKKASLVTKD